MYIYLHELKGCICKLQLSQLNKMQNFQRSTFLHHNYVGVVSKHTKYCAWIFSINWSLNPYFIILVHALKMRWYSELICGSWQQAGTTCELLKDLGRHDYWKLQFWWNDSYLGQANWQLLSLSWTVKITHIWHEGNRSAYWLANFRI